jgi:hypothetical protein
LPAVFRWLPLVRLLVGGLVLGFLLLALLLARLVCSVVGLVVALLGLLVPRLAGLRLLLAGRGLLLFRLLVGSCGCFSRSAPLCVAARWPRGGLLSRHPQEG